MRAGSSVGIAGRTGAGKSSLIAALLRLAETEAGVVSVDGVDVALIGAVGYAGLFVVSTIGTMSKYEDETWPNTLMQLMIWPAVLFTLRLKYGEFIVLKGFCSWCVVSAVTITLCAVLVTLDRKRLAKLA